MNYRINLSEENMRTLSGLLDTAVKALGLRSLGADVVSLVQAIEAAEQTAEIISDNAGASSPSVVQ